VTAFHVYLVNRVPTAARRISHFEDGTRSTVQATLQDLFTRVCEGTSYTAEVTWDRGTPGENELVAYFVTTREQSVIDRLGGTPSAHAEGRTALTARGMVSEVYVSEAGPMAAMIAKCAFHELMHNKLDLRRHPAVRDIHSHGGGGLAAPSIGPSSELNSANIRLMRAALQVAVPQYTGDMP